MSPKSSNAEQGTAPKHVYELSGELTRLLFHRAALCQIYDSIFRMHALQFQQVCFRAYKESLRGSAHE